MAGPAPRRYTPARGGGRAPAGTPAERGHEDLASGGQGWAARMSGTGHPGTLVRLVNALVALAIVALAFATYWPMTRLVELHRADLGIRGEWIGNHAKRITRLEPAGVAGLAGLRVGDVLEFDPGRDDDWVLAGYRDMPQGFTAQLLVQRVSGSRALVLLEPDRVAFLSGVNDVLATVAQLTTASVVILLGVGLIWVRPGLMTWSLFLAYFSAFPYYPWTAYLLAYQSGRTLEFWAFTAGLFVSSIIAIVPFALCFPRDCIRNWSVGRQALVVAPCAAAVVVVGMHLRVIPFERDLTSFGSGHIALVLLAFVPVLLVAVLLLVRSHRAADGPTRARLRWVLLGMAAAMTGIVLAIVLGLVPYLVDGAVSGAALTVPGWGIVLCAGILFPIALGVAVLRERVVDIQFAVSRTLVFGAVSSLVLVVLAAVHWLLGKLIEQTHLAIWIEGVVAVGVGLVLHRVTRASIRLVDRLLFRRRHAAEAHLRRVEAALPFATHGRSIAEGLVIEPARELDLASAAVFYREGVAGPLQRMLSQGWTDEHVTVLDADCLLVRTLQVSHAPLRIDGHDLLPPDTPQGAGQPVLAIPLASQQVLRAVMLYGAHHNATLPDPDEVALLHELATAAEASYQQVRIRALSREIEQQSAKIAVLEACRPGPQASDAAACAVPVTTQGSGNHEPS